MSVASLARPSPPACAGRSGPKEAFRTDNITAEAFARVADHWRALVARTALPNVFVEPGTLLAAAQAGLEPRIFLVWRSEEGSASESLIGAWAVTTRRPVPWLPIKVLFSPISPLAYVGTPVVDPAHAEAAFSALLAAMAQDPSLPDLLLAGDLNDEPPLVGALRQALRRRNSAAQLLARRTRAKLQAAGDPSYWNRGMSAKQRQSLAAKRRKLAKLGTLTTHIARDRDGLRAAFEAFLSLEASGWKGQRASAIASNEQWARFARTMIATLAEAGLVSIHEMRLDGQPVAMWVVLYSGTAAFTWRTAYDESLGRFSPGLLILEDTTNALVTNPSLSYVDSCNHEDRGHQAERWNERHDVVDFLIDLRPGRHLSFGVVATAIMQTARARERARSIYHFLRRRLSSVRQSGPGR